MQVASNQTCYHHFEETEPAKDEHRMDLILIDCANNSNSIRKGEA